MRQSQNPHVDRIGIDLGGTKIEGIRMAHDGATRARLRLATPRDDYQATIAAIVEVVAALDLDQHNPSAANASPASRVGIGMPGSISKRTGRVHNANSTWLNGRDLITDLTAALGRRVLVSNDANCFALSEAIDGSGAGATTVFGVIIGTGTGSGIVINGRIVDGPLGIGGEFGHNPLPWATVEAGEVPGRLCWCGRSGCLETWVSGPALSAAYELATGLKQSAAYIAELADTNDATAKHVLTQHASRLARGLAQVVNIFDPDVIVLGGGLSNLQHLYRVLPDLMRPHIFSDDPRVDIRPPRWGDASGVRGAAHLASAMER